MILCCWMKPSPASLSKEPQKQSNIVILPGYVHSFSHGNWLKVESSMLYIISCIYTQILPKQFHISAHTNMAKHTQYVEMLRPENNSEYLAGLVTQAWQPCKRTVSWTYTGVCLEIRIAWFPVYNVQFLYVQDKRWPAWKNSGDVFGRSSETAVSCCTVIEFQRWLLKWPNGV